jgi:hypothetical protein
MLRKRLVVLGAIAALPAFAQLSSAPPAAERIAHRQHGPIRELLDHGDGKVTSVNWSGYALTGASFTAAKGTWIVPAVICSSGDQYAGFYVGLDGYSSGTVEQTGTESDCDGGTPSYYAWYEFYPSASVEITSLTIAPGDRMLAKVVYNGSDFTIAIADLTTGKSYSKSATVAGAKRSSAEWIAEAPCCGNGGGILPLADFGTVLFGGDNTGITGTCSAEDSSTKGPLGSFSTIKEITMVTPSSGDEAVPSALSGDGSSFSIMWAAQ